MVGRSIYSNQRDGWFQNPQGLTQLHQLTLGSASLFFPCGCLLRAEAVFFSLIGRFQKHVFKFHDQENKTQKSESVPLIPSKVRSLSLCFLSGDPPFPGIIDNWKISTSLVGHPDPNSKMCDHHSTLTSQNNSTTHFNKIKSEEGRGGRLISTASLLRVAEEARLF